LVAAGVGSLLNAGKAEEAASVAQQALEKNPGDPVLRKLVVSTQPGLTPEQRDQALLEIIEQVPDAYQRSLELFSFYGRKGDWERALAHVNEAERHLLQGDTPLAQAAMASQHREILLQKLRIAAQLKNEPAQAEAVDSASKHDVDGAGGKSVLGVYHVYRDELEPAIRALREAVEAQPTDAQSLAYLGHCYLTLGRSDDAQAYFERAVRINPDDILAHRGLAAIALARGEKDDYDREFEICRGLAPNDSWVQAEEMARKEQAEPQAAIERREAALRDQPDDVENLRRLARLCEDVKDLDKADRYQARRGRRTQRGEVLSPHESAGSRLGDLDPLRRRPSDEGESGLRQSTPGRSSLESREAGRGGIEPSGRGG
jgi:tetratricopeptide (TPR) repeat protein